MNKLFSREIKSFSYAIAGISYAFKTQVNFKIQVSIGLFAIVLAWFFGFSKIEWLVLLVSISMILSAELANTVVERIVDFKTEVFHDDAKIIKDLSAGVVLVVSIFVAAVGIMLFVPHLI